MFLAHYDLLLLVERQCECKGAALAWFAHHLDGSAMCLDGIFYHGKAYAIRSYGVWLVCDRTARISSSDISEGERDTINRILDDFEFTYGYRETKTFSDVLSSGSISFSGSNPMKIGGVATTTQTVGKNEDGKIFDSRNGVMAYVRGDIADVLSYDLNFKVNFDRIDPNAFLPTELL